MRLGSIGDATRELGCTLLEGPRTFCNGDIIVQNKSWKGVDLGEILRIVRKCIGVGDTKNKNRRKPNPRPG